MTTLFIDEGKHTDYVVVAATVADANVVRLRKEVAALKMPGSERLHFVKESDGHRRKVLTTLGRLGVRTTVFHVAGLKDREARIWCLNQVVDLAMRVDASRIVIETDDSIMPTDNRTLFQALKDRALGDQIQYEHARAAAEPLLWVPDAVAWSYGRGGQWASLVKPLIDDIRRHRA